jgi:hypothetical protein
LQEILRGIDQEELNGVFQAWVWRAQKVSQGKPKQAKASQGNGDYAR